jgi:hypothetical protein
MQLTSAPPACGVDTYSSAGDTSCTACPAGSTSVEASASCSCTAGFALAGSGASLVCTACSPGTFSTSGASCLRTLQRRVARDDDLLMHGGARSLLGGLVLGGAGIHLLVVPGQQRQQRQRLYMHVQRRLCTERRGLQPRLRQYAPRHHPRIHPLRLLTSHGGDDGQRQSARPTRTTRLPAQRSARRALLAAAAATARRRARVIPALPRAALVALLCAPVRATRLSSRGGNSQAR